MKTVRRIGAGIEAATWLLLHLFAHILLVIGFAVTLLQKGTEASLLYIREVQEGLAQRIAEGSK